MARRRKTIEVERIRDIINGHLETSPPEDVSARSRLIDVLVTILMETGNYRGYRESDWASEDSRRYYF